MAEMAASIAHELNQPLTAVVTHAYACREWLNSTPANVERASTTAEKIVQESTRASAVVKRVRSLFRKDQEGPFRESADINQLIRELVRLLREEAIRREVSIRLDLADDLARVEIDSIQIQQVLLNLANNGMEAMADTPAHRELTIQHAQSERARDSCIGCRYGMRCAGRHHGQDVRSVLHHKTAEVRAWGSRFAEQSSKNMMGTYGFRIRQQGGAVFQFTLKAQA